MGSLDWLILAIAALLVLGVIGFLRRAQAAFRWQEEQAAIRRTEMYKWLSEQIDAADKRKEEQ